MISKAVSRIEKVIYSLYFCYLPVLIIGLGISYFLFTITPGKCFGGSITLECFVGNSSYDFIYHPINLVNLVFTVYNLLYLYYNVILNRHVVGRAVKKIYRRLQKKYYLGNKRQQISILLFCYITALCLSYFRFALTIVRAI